ncbi:MAG: LysE family translocator [Proteobacteria bacterium]|nr:LysE family translocator [Pseudomonadota bacterium]
MLAPPPQDHPESPAVLNPLPFMTYAFAMSITPGPNNVMLTASGATFGFRRTLPHLLGVVFGFVVQLLAVCLGLSVLFTRWPALQTALSWAGAAYLVYLGARMLRSAGAQAEGESRPVRFLEAAMFQFLNPKAWVMSITSAALFLPQELGLFARSAYMALVMEGVGVPCMAAWALFGSSLKNFLAAPRARVVFNGFMAVTLAGTALVMVVK